MDIDSIDIDLMVILNNDHRSKTAGLGLMKKTRKLFFDEVERTGKIIYNELGK
jgi:hypothetical protein